MTKPFKCGYSRWRINPSPKPPIPGWTAVPDSILPSNALSSRYLLKECLAKLLMSFTRRAFV